MVGVSAAASEKLKLTGAELTAITSRYRVSAGISHATNANWMIVGYANGTLDLYWNDGIRFDTDNGTHRVQGNQSCVTWKKSDGGEERCYDVYRIGDNNYESWRNGKLEHTSYKIR